MRRPARLVLLAVALAAPAGSEQRSDLQLPAPLLAGTVAAGRGWLLVGGEDGPRQLLELSLAPTGARLRSVLRELPLGLDAVMAPPEDGAREPRLLLSQGETTWAFDGSPSLSRVYPGPGRPLPGPARGRFTAAPPWLLAAGAGEARVLVRDGKTLQAAAVSPLPVEARVERWGLRLSSPPARFADRWLVVGPRQDGLHLHTLLLGADGERRELTALLPAPERLAESVVLALDGRPTLVAGTFQGLGLMSRKQLRVFALVGEPGAAPRRPLLARELETRAWQDLTVHAGDLDRDGRDDLALAADLGLDLGEVSVILFRGLGGGRLRAEPVRARYPMKERTWRYGADVDGDGRADLVSLGSGRVEVHLAEGAAGLPAKRPTRSIALSGTAGKPSREVAVEVGTRGARAESRAASEPLAEGVAEAVEEGEEVRPEWELVDLDGDRRAELLWWTAGAKGRPVRLVVLRF